MSKASRAVPAVLFCLVLAVAGALASCGGDGGSEPGARELEAREAPGGGTLWVLSRADRELAVIDPVTARVVSRVRLGFRSDPSDLVYWDGSVWVGSAGGMLQRVDAASRSLEETIPVDVDLGWVSAAEHGIYGVDGELGVVTRHDPGTGALLAELGPSGRIHAMAAGPESVAAVVSDMAQTHFYGPGALEPRIVSTELGSGEMVLGFGSFWLYQLDGRLLRVDPNSGAVQAEVEMPEVMDARGITIGEDAVWVTSPELGEVFQVDPTTDRLVRRIRVGGAPEHLAELGDALWVIFPQDDVVARLDRTTGEATARVEVGWPLRIIAVP
jgi:hypothetical protein